MWIPKCCRAVCITGKRDAGVLLGLDRVMVGLATNAAQVRVFQK